MHASWQALTGVRAGSIANRILGRASRGCFILLSEEKLWNHVSKPDLNSAPGVGRGAGSKTLAGEEEEPEPAAQAKPESSLRATAPVFIPEPPPAVASDDQMHFAPRELQKLIGMGVPEEEARRSFELFSSADEAAAFFFS